MNGQARQQCCTAETNQTEPEEQARGDADSFAGSVILQQVHFTEACRPACTYRAAAAVSAVRGAWWLVLRKAPIVLAVGDVRSQRRREHFEGEKERQRKRRGATADNRSIHRCAGAAVRSAAVHPLHAVSCVAAATTRTQQQASNSIRIVEY